MRPHIVSIFIAPDAGIPMQSVQQVLAMAGKGLQGDRYAEGKGSFNLVKGVGNRQVTFANEKFFRGPGFSPDESRRNIFTKDTELVGLIGKEFQIGKACFLGIEPCTPCDRPSQLIGTPFSFKLQFSDCGGLVAAVIADGIIRVGDDIIIDI